MLWQTTYIVRFALTKLLCKNTEFCSTIFIYPFRWCFMGGIMAWGNMWNMFSDWLLSFLIVSRLLISRLLISRFGNFLANLATLTLIIIMVTFLVCIIRTALQHYHIAILIFMRGSTDCLIHFARIVKSKKLRFILKPRNQSHWCMNLNIDILITVCHMTARGGPWVVSWRELGCAVLQWFRGFGAAPNCRRPNFWKFDL